MAKEEYSKGDDYDCDGMFNEIATAGICIYSPDENHIHQNAIEIHRSSLEEAQELRDKILKQLQFWSE